MKKTVTCKNCQKQTEHEEGDHCQHCGHCPICGKLTNHPIHVCKASVSGNEFFVSVSFKK